MREETMIFPQEKDLRDYAAQLAKTLDHGAIIYLEGPLGVGKTTFVRGFLRGLGFQGKVKSPTYTLVESYEIAKRQVIHFDFYRIKQMQELVYMGIQDYFSNTAICLIEWPEKGLAYLPTPTIICQFEFALEGRKVMIKRQST